MLPGGSNVDRRDSGSGLPLEPYVPSFPEDQDSPTGVETDVLRWR